MGPKWCLLRQPLRARFACGTSAAHVPFAETLHVQLHADTDTQLSNDVLIALKCNGQWILMPWLHTLLWAVLLPAAVQPSLYDGGDAASGFSTSLRSPIHQHDDQVNNEWYGVPLDLGNFVLSTFKLRCLMAELPPLMPVTSSTRISCSDHPHLKVTLKGKGCLLKCLY